MSAFAESVEAWVPGHTAALRQLNLEELVGVGNKAFDAISDLDLNWHEFNVTAERPYDDAIAEEIDRLYRDWAAASVKLLGPINDSRSDGYNLKGAEVFLRNVAEAQAVAAGPGMEMPDGLVRLRDEGLAEHRAAKTVEMTEIDD